MWFLLACTGTPDPADDTGLPADDTADQQDDTAGDTAVLEGVGYRGTTGGTVDADHPYACVGFSAFRLLDDGSVVGDAEAHCSWAEDASVFQHLEGPIAGTTVGGTLTASWTITVCDSETTLELVGTTSPTAVEATFGADTPCVVAGAMSAEVE